MWDGPEIPDRELFAGQAAGSARPLVWAHAEFLKLRRSIEDGRVFDQPPQTVARYVTAGKRTTPYAVWRFNNKIRTMAAGKVLRVETLGPAIVHWGPGGSGGPGDLVGWQQIHDTVAIDTGLGVWVADLPTTALRAGARVDFTFYWPEVARWEGADFRVVVARSG